MVLSELETKSRAIQLSVASSSCRTKLKNDAFVQDWACATPGRALMNYTPENTAPSPVPLRTESPESRKRFATRTVRCADSASYVSCQSATSTPLKVMLRLRQCSTIGKSGHWSSQRRRRAQPGSTGRANARWAPHPLPPNAVEARSALFPPCRQCRIANRDSRERPLLADFVEEVWQ